MKLFGNLFYKDSEDLASDVEQTEVMDSIPEPAAQNAPLVLNIEGIEEDVEDQATPLCIREQAEAQSKEAADHSAMASALRSILDEKTRDVGVIPGEHAEVSASAPSSADQPQAEAPAIPAADPVSDAADPADAVSDAADPVSEAEAQEKAPSASVPAAAPEAKDASVDETEETETAAVPENGSAGEETAVEEEAEAVQQPSVTFRDVADAIEANQVKEPTLTRSAIDDDTLLSEIYALIGSAGKSRPQPPRAPSAEARKLPEAPELSQISGMRSQPKAGERTQPVPALTDYAEVATTPWQPEMEEELPADEEGGAPGWLKGAFLLLISLMLSGMTLYAVAADVIGKLF